MTSKFPLYALVFLLLLLCSGCSTEPTEGTKAPDGSAEAAIPPATEGCEQTPEGCLIFRCNCEDGATSRTFADKVGGGCLNGLETCAQVCQPRSRVVEPVACSRKVAEVDASTPPPATDAGPKPGKPGGPCDRTLCAVDSCECKDGSQVSNAGGICRNNVCSSLEETCKLACESNGGWTGVGVP